jgi:hypothetical protein
MSIFLNHPFLTPPPVKTSRRRHLYVWNVEENIEHNEVFGDIRRFVKLQNRQTSITQII